MVDGKVSEGYWQVDDLSVSALCEYLNAIETLWEILEFATNIERNFTINGDLRVKTKTNDAFSAHCKVEAARLGNRASRLQLPPNWTKGGVYLVREEGGQLIIKHQYMPREAIVPPEIHHGWAPGTAFEVEYNYSENQAMLKLPQCRVSLVCFFGDASGINIGAFEQQGVKRQLALLGPSDMDTGSPRIRMRRKTSGLLALANIASGSRADSNTPGAAGPPPAHHDDGPHPENAGDGADDGSDMESDDELHAAPPPPTPAAPSFQAAPEASLGELLEAGDDKST